MTLLPWRIVSATLKFQSHMGIYVCVWLCDPFLCWFSIDYKTAIRLGDVSTWQTLTEQDTLIEYQLCFNVNFSAGRFSIHCIKFLNGLLIATQSGVKLYWSSSDFTVFAPATDGSFLYSLLMVVFLLYFSICIHIDIYDVIMESEQLERNGFNLNPVLKMAIMRKVRLTTQPNSNLNFDNVLSMLCR